VRRRSARGSHRGERGSATVFFLGFAIVLFLCAGLVLDGGLAINKRMRIADDAEQAARIGADSIDVGYVRQTDTLRINESLARQRIAAYLSDLGYSADTYSAQVAAGNVTVRVSDRSNTFILGLFGISFPVRASADAVPDTGAPAP
jgi:Flp pilus assembly protein TadG